jgi:hypothetical protein
VPSDPHFLLLLSDAVDRTLANPCGSHCWLNLIGRTRAIEDGDVLAQVVAAVTAGVPDQGLPGYYRALYLDITTGDLRHAGRAAAIAATLAPRDQDRLAALFDSNWKRALLYADDRSAFIANLHTMGVPALAMLMGAEDSAPPAPARASGALRHVVLVAPVVISARHPPTRMLLDQAETLLRHGVRVTLVSCQEYTGPDFEHLLGREPGSQTETVNLDDWRAGAGAAAGLYLASPNASLQRRWRDMLPLIHAAEPDLIMLVGLHSGLVNALYPHYPVLGLATNSVPPIAATDVWLTALAGMHGRQAAPWESGLPPSEAYYHPFRARRKPCAGPLPRSAMGVPDDAVLAISLGSHLDVKIAGVWAQRMCRTMAAHPRLHWLLLGGTGKTPPALAGLDPARLTCLPYSTQATEMLAASDLYLNPPMMGGGISVAEAMSLGLPVLSLAGSDGGDKLGEEAMQDEDAYFAQLHAWLADPGLRRAAGARQRQRFDSALDLEQAGASLLGACELARQRYRLRSASPDLPALS